MTITDSQIDAHLETIKPRLRAAIRAAFEQLAPVNFLKLAEIPLPSGQTWQLVLAVMTEPTAKLFWGTQAWQAYQRCLPATERCRARRLLLLRMVP